MSELVQAGYDGVVIGMLYALVALGLIVVLRANNVLNFGQASIATTAGYLSWRLSELSGLPYGVAFAVSVLGGGAVGVALGLLVERLMRRSSVLEKSIATLGFSLVLAWLNRELFGGQSRNGAVPVDGGFQVGSVAISWLGVFVIVVSAIAIAAVIWMIQRTTFGLHLRALSQDREVARAFGVSETRIVLTAWFVGSCLASISGVLVGAFFQVDHAIMLTIMIQALAAMVIGGFGSVLGALVGAIVLGTSSSLISTYTSTGFKNVIIFAAVLLVLAVRPRGLLNVRSIVVSEGVQEDHHPRLPRWDHLRSRPTTPILTVGVVALLVVLPYLRHPFGIVTYSVLLCTAAAVVSLNVVMGYLGEVSLGHGAFVTVGAYVAAIASQRWTDLSPVAVMLLAAALSAAFGALVGTVTLRLSSHYLAMATLFLPFVLTELINNTRETTGGVAGTSVNSPDLFFATYSRDVDLYYLSLATFLVVASTVAIVMRSKFGMALVALRDAPRAAAAHGVPVNQFRVIAVALSTALAGVAGAAMGYVQTFIGPEFFGLNWSVMLLLAVLVGGAGSSMGALFGAALIVFVPQMFAGGGGVSDLLLGIALIVVLVALPGGLPSLGGLIRGRYMARRAGPASSGGLSETSVRVETHA